MGEVLVCGSQDRGSIPLISIYLNPRRKCCIVDTDVGAPLRYGCKWFLDRKVEELVEKHPQIKL